MSAARFLTGLRGLRGSVRELFNTARDMETGQPRLRICREGNNAGGMHHLILFQGGRDRLGMLHPYVGQIAFLASSKKHAVFTSFALVVRLTCVIVRDLQFR